MPDRSLPPGLSLGGRKVLVLGLRVTNTDVARVLAEHGADVFASEAGAVDDITRTQLPGVEIESGGHAQAMERLHTFDFVVPSPGISPLRGPLAEIIDAGVPIVSELEIGAAMIANSEATIVAVTGTNGKTTVCRLAERIGRAAGIETYACGNTETPFVTAADSNPRARVFVVEASSFRLAFADTFHPRVAVVTNLASDHLDWHGTFEHYRDSKAKIAARQGGDDLYLYPASQPELKDLAPPSGPTRVGFDARWLASNPGAGAVARGPHFAADAAAAALAMSFLGADDNAISEGLEGFVFDPHRLDPVGTLDGVSFVDDAVSANVDATLAALRSFDRPVVLICGGRNKGLDLRPLAQEARRLRAAVVIGESAPVLTEIFEGAKVLVKRAGSMDDAVTAALEESKEGDVILLSPACASHDMFTNYAERGAAFLAACQRLGVG